MHNSNITKVLIKYIEYITSEKVALINLPESAPASLLQNQATSITNDFTIHQEHIANNLPCLFGYEDTTIYQTIVLSLPKSNDDIDMMLDYCQSKLDVNGKLILVGENKSGIKPSIKTAIIKNFILEKEEYARHCVLAVFKNRLTKKFNLDNYKKTFQYKDINIISYPGTFSHGVPDKGTEALLSQISLSGKEKVLDLACGNGIIGAYIKKQYPNTDITQSDTHWTSLLACKQTMQTNNLASNILPSNIFKEIKDKYDIITCNIPFHSGIKSDYSFASNLFNNYNDYLTSNGKLLIVANTFLPYEKLMPKNKTKLTETKGFKVYQIEKAMS